MTKKARWAWTAPLAPVAIAAGVLLVFRVFVVGCEGSVETLGGAELFASDGNALTRELNEGGATLDDVDLESATQVTASADGGLLVLVEAPGGEDLVQASSNGNVKRASSVILHTVLRTDTAIDVSPDGTLVTAGEDNGPKLAFQDFDFGPLGPGVATRFVVGSIDERDDGTTLVGGQYESRIDAIAEDGTTTGLMGPPGSDARVVLPEPLGRIVSLVGLADGRVVFVADTADGFEMYVLDETEVRPVVPDGPSPVRSAGERPTDPLQRVDRLAMMPLAPAPGGRVLATGLGQDGDPEISVVDLDSGEVEVLAVLEDVEATIDQPVSAAAVDQDLIFLAEGKLWKLEGAFATG